ncbi:MAG: glyoxalase/bleomycin resistance/extradiol dioxygenase family protein [Gemmatimonadaceae bacterium]|nr:glyoxalase/bleomycin resistance/extradiol dioxygenase family protein [Gemmatimonadaceae bacterium]
MPVPVVYPITLTPSPVMAARKLFVNIRVSDLEQSKVFFGALGFTFNPQFTDENAACMVVNDDAFFMLLTDPFFRRFTDREPADTTRVSEALYAFSCDSREEVTRLTDAALAAGATTAMPPQDHGFMYSTSFHTPDGHHFEVVWMDPATIQ